MCINYIFVGYGFFYFISSHVISEPTRVQTHGSCLIYICWMNEWILLGYLYLSSRFSNIVARMMFIKHLFSYHPSGYNGSLFFLRGMTQCLLVTHFGVMNLEIHTVAHTSLGSLRSYHMTALYAEPALKPWGRGQSVWWLVSWESQVLWRESIQHWTKKIYRWIREAEKQLQGRKQLFFLIHNAFLHFYFFSKLAFLWAIIKTNHKKKYMEYRMDKGKIRLTRLEYY